MCCCLYNVCCWPLCVWSCFCDEIACILSSPALFSLRKKMLIILHCVLIFCLWSLCLDICGRTVKLSFLSCGFNGVRQTTALLGNCTGGSEGCYDVTQTVFFPERWKNLFSFSLMLDNDCCAVEILWRNLETDKRISKRSQNTRESEN